MNVINPVQKNTKATVSLVLGIVSIFCLGLIAGIPAIIVGRQAQTESPVGHGKAQAGIVPGWISIVLSIIGVIIAVTSH